MKRCRECGGPFPCYVPSHTFSVVYTVPVPTGDRYATHTPTYTGGRKIETAPGCYRTPPRGPNE